MTVEPNTLPDWRHLIEAEYLEMPGLNLTRPQVQRMWGLDPHVCDEVLDALITTHVLRQTDHGTFALAIDNARR